MGFKCGIVGLPNVGKSTLFNALTATQAAQAANYPFCTIEPNIGKVSVPDERLFKLAALANSQKIIPNQLEFVDIAGIVKGASKGEGLGNKFLAHIREVDAIIHVLRCFNDTDITHVEKDINPIRDLEIIEIELILADIESLEKRLPGLEKKARLNDKSAQQQLKNIQVVLEVLSAGRLASNSELSALDLKELNLITSKPIMYVANVLEEEATGGNEMSKRLADHLNDNKLIIISSKIEAEIALLESLDERNEFLEAVGLKQTGLDQIINTGYRLLGLLSFFTIGPKEARAWSVKNGATAPEAAGVIHTDFERGFIRAETISYFDYLNLGSEQAAKEMGKMRLEGKEYLVQDGDVFHFRFNV